MDIALFSPSSLFQEEDDDGSEVQGEGDAPWKQQTYLERTHVFPGGLELCVREYSFHQLNANLLWPGTFAFCEWILQHPYMMGFRTLELGSGTGALAIFLKKSFGIDITTSDYDDREIEENIAYNCRSNGLEVLSHISHTWGEPFPMKDPDWDVVIASDILLYVKQYPNLIKSLSFLLKEYKPKCTQDGTSESSTPDGRGSDVQLQLPMFLMSWRRRIGREDETLFFKGCEEAGLAVEHLGSRVYRISPRKGDEA